MQRRRIQRVTTAGLATAAIASLVAACGSSGGGSPSSSSSSSSSAALSGTLNGSGSTFQLTFQQEAISGFKSVQSGVTVNYGGGGSGKGRTDLASGVVNYAGSDSTIPPAETANFKGKTVLFISEKKAALEVVRRRLADIKLDAYCLEVHSDKARKTEVIEQLKAPLAANVPKTQAKWQATSESLGKSRLRLNEYVEALHYRYPCELSIYECTGWLCRNPAATAARGP